MLSANLQKSKLFIRKKKGYILIWDREMLQMVTTTLYMLPYIATAMFNGSLNTCHKQYDKYVKMSKFCVFNPIMNKEYITTLAMLTKNYNSLSN